MRKLLHPQTVTLLLGSAARITAGVLRSTGGLMRGVADLLDPRAPDEGGRPSPEHRVGGPGDRNGYVEQEGARVRGGERVGERQPGDLQDAHRAAQEAPGVTAPRPRRAAPSAPPRSPGAPHPSGSPRSPRRSSPSAREPGHVSPDVELVAEFADPGAQDGAGAVIHVAEPWPGYAQMHANDITDRLAAESPSVLAVVELYEQSHRRRRTVLQATARELRRRANLPGS